MKVITQAKLNELLEALKQTHTLIAPVEVSGDLLYRQVDDVGGINWTNERTRLSAKDALFPQTERLLFIEQASDALTLREAPPPGPQVLIGVRSCDARGIQALDALFIDAPPTDEAYARRRAETTVIGLACTQMGESCFCTSVGGAPNDTSGMDLMLTPVDGGYSVEAVTEHGQTLLENMTLQSVAGDPPAPVLNDPLLNLPTEYGWQSRFAEALWAELAERCISCRSCAYVCPTCRCFDLRDEPLPADNGVQRFERVRGWDSCAGTLYRKEASGHTPRGEKAERLRNRFMCKFSYFPQQTGAQACTGCGRCIDACPAGVDITEVLAAVAEPYQEVAR